MTVSEKLAQLRDMKAELGPALAEMKRLENEIKAELLETGEKVNVDGVTVTFRKGGLSTRWDSKALEGYAIAYPEVLEFKTVSERKASVAFKFGG